MCEACGSFCSLLTPADNGKLELATGSRGRSGQAMGSSSGSRMRLELLPALASLHCERELGEVDARQLAS